MNILIALDYTHHRELLLRQGIQFAQSNNASLTLLHVFSFGEKNEKNEHPAINLSSIPTSEVSNADFEKWCQTARESESKLQATVEQIQSLGLTVEGQHILGQPGPVICARAEMLKSDVIMIGRRRQHSQSLRSLGSVSNYVVHHAHCSVWIIQEDSENISSMTEVHS